MIDRIEATGPLPSDTRLRETARKLARAVGDGSDATEIIEGWEHQQASLQAEIEEALPTLSWERLKTAAALFRDPRSLDSLQEWSRRPDPLGPVLEALGAGEAAVWR
jgi:hypothetical protein